MNLYFAPFHGLGQRLFREIYFKHFTWFDYIITPFMPTGISSILTPARFKDVFPLEKNTRIIPQIIGNDTVEIVDTVNYLYDLGFEQINLNLGCPMQQIVRKRRACGLMPYPEKIVEIVENVCNKTSAKFSLKMRLGMYSKNESLKIIEQLNHLPLDFIVIHARLGIQEYSGTPDWNAFEKCVSFSKNKIIYNGDIFSMTDFQLLRNKFPFQEEFMIGRGALQNPFLSAEIKGIKFEKNEQKQLFSLFYKELVFNYKSYYYKQKSILNRLKELWKYFAYFYELSPSEIQNLLRISDFNDFELQTDRILAEK